MKRSAVRKRPVSGSTSVALIDSIVKVHRARTSTLDKETRTVYRQSFREILLETAAKSAAIDAIVAPGERADLEELVRREMGGAYPLSVPLEVSVGVGTGAGPPPGITARTGRKRSSAV